MPIPNGVGDVIDKVRTSLDSMGAAERKVGRTLIGNYPSAGLQSVVMLANQAGVSPPTVTRFARRLGYGGFPDLQTALRRELECNGASPTALYARYRDHGLYTGSAGVLGSYTEALTENIHRVRHNIDEEKLVRCAQIFANEGRAVWMRGGRWSRSLAIFFSFQLNYVRDRVRLIDDSLGDPADLAVDIGADETLMIFDFRRYDSVNARLAALARRRGARVILMTDEGLSPISDFADVVLAIPIETPSPFDSLVAPLAVLEAILVGIVRERGDVIQARMKAVDASRAALLDRDDKAEDLV